MGNLTSSNKTEELRRQIDAGLNRAGKHAGPELINNAIRIFKKTKRVHWDHQYLERWWKWGFHYVYLVTEAMDAEVEPLLELVRMDKQLGYSCQYLEYFIFRHKALKIIDQEEVGNCQSDSFSSDQKLNYYFRLGTNGATLKRTVWFYS